MTHTTESWTAGPTREATDADLAAIRAVILDYFEGWFAADAERMRRALHPDLAKRSFGQDRERTPVVATTTAAEMIRATAAGGGSRRSRLDARTDIRVDLVSGGIASVIVDSDVYVECLHLVDTAEGWKIVNGLWRFADGRGPLDRP
jgi:hypothetical protein